MFSNAGHSDILQCSHLTNICFIFPTNASIGNCPLVMFFISILAVMASTSSQRSIYELDLKVEGENSEYDETVVQLEQGNVATNLQKSPLAECDWSGNAYFSLPDIVNRKKPVSEIDGIRSKETREFYENQNQTIQMLESLAEPDEDDEEEGERRNKAAQIAIWASFIVNITLVIIKVTIAIRSRSMSVIASALDSVLDILSGSVLFVIERLRNSPNRESFPIGKDRLEPLGVIVFSTVMFTAALQLIIESFKRIILQDSTIKVDYITIGMLVATIFVKAILFIYCRFFVSGSPSAAALAQDHRNDVFSNSGAIAFALIGYYSWWPADPIGAVAIGLLIMCTWAKTGFENIRMLTGYRAGGDFMKKWTFISLQHDIRICAIDTVRAYHLSNGFIVEVDIVLPSSMPLNEAHDIGESLQMKLESLEEVERAFVHLDYESTHKPEH